MAAAAGAEDDGRAFLLAPLAGDGYNNIVASSKKYKK